MGENNAFSARSFRTGQKSSLVAAASLLAILPAAQGAESGTVPFELPEISVIATTPVGGTGISEDK